MSVTPTSCLVRILPIMPRPATQELPTGDNSQMGSDDAGPNTEPLEPVHDPVEAALPTPQQPETPASPPSVRRSSRQRKAPDWVTTYVPS